ncbi:MAG: molybdopterin-dependent oxidoreductase, partial [Desulfohalobiaceae bacterium]|nr:molybdopterin-dependent oxidoreductase [Desulfohalobiaceae bacterium]
GNEQGLCDLGALPGLFPGYQDVTGKEIRQKLMHTWDVKRLPDTPGLHRPEMFERASAGKLRSLYIIGDNPLDVDQEQESQRKDIEQALRKLSFLVVQDIFLTETALKADVVLPGACFGEKEGTVTNAERLLQRVRKGLKPPGEAREDQRIIMDLARRMGYPMDFPSSAAVMEEIARVTPLLAGIRYPRLEKGGLAWPCPTPQHPGTPRLYTEGFKERRAVFAKLSEE